MSAASGNSEVQSQSLQLPCPNSEEVSAIEDGEDVQDTKLQETHQHEKRLEETFADLDLETAEEEDDKEKNGEENEEYEEINEEFLCNICDDRFKMPKVLSCLHVFCQECLEKQMEPDTPDEANQSQSSTIICVICNQETRVGSKGVAELQPDNVMVNLQDMEAIKKMRIICTSCKAKEKAVARCSDCANFLCPNCVTAHQYMRCFENHKVVSFDDMGSNFSLHKPLFCTNHPTESLKYFCKTCQIPVCTECMVTSHKHPEHESDRIGELDDTIRNEVASLLKEAKGKVDYCEQASSNLENSLTDLQMQRDDARGLIEETFQTYRAIIEERKHALLVELEDIHNRQQDSIMHVFDNVGKTIDKIEDSRKFTERVMEHGNCTEVLLVKRLLFTQLMSLINNTPRADVNVKIDFDTDVEKFRAAVTTHFGSFKKDAPVKDAPASLHSSFEGEGINLPSSLLSPDTPLLTQTPDLTQGLGSLPPLSLPNMSVPPSLSGVSPQTINSIASSIQSLTGVVPPPQTAPVERSSSRNSYSPAMSDSGISVDAASNGSGSNPSGVNFAALQRLGSVNANSQGQILVNGQLIPGLNVGNVAGFPPLAGVTQRSGTPTTPDPGLATLLGGGMHPPPPVAVPRPTTPIADIGNVLNQPPVGMPITGQLPGQIGGISMRSPTGAFNIHSHPPFPPRSTGKVNPMQIRCKFGQLGPGKSQFNSPHGFCLGMDEDIVVADTNNHRVQIFEKTGEFKYQFGIPGREEGQLWYPRKVAVIRVSGKYVVCDRGNERSRMQIFTKSGHFIKKIAIRYIDIVAGLAISQAGHIVAVDSVSPTVFVISEGGDLVKWFDCSDYMREPSDIAVSGKEYFVCDFKGHCVVVFNEDGQFLRRIGCENITNFPNGIDISDAGDVLVGDSHGNRFHVAVFQRDGSLIGEFECPYVKVSRCCGLKITSEGYVVTLAKNNHHVLVLNTLYIT